MIQFRIPLIHDTYRFSQMFLEAIQTVDTNAPDTSNQERCMKLLIIQTLLSKPNFVPAHHLVQLHRMVEELEQQLAPSETSDNAPIHLDEYDVLTLHDTVQHLVHYGYLLSKKELEDITLASITNACICAINRPLLSHPVFQPLIKEVQVELNKKQVPASARKYLLPQAEGALPGYVNPYCYIHFFCETLKAKPLDEFDRLIEEYILQIRIADMQEKIVYADNRKDAQIVTHVVEAILDSDPSRIVVGGRLQISAEKQVQTIIQNGHTLMKSCQSLDFDDPTPLQMVYILNYLVLSSDVLCVQNGCEPPRMHYKLHPDAPTL